VLVSSSVTGSKYLVLLPFKNMINVDTRGYLGGQREKVAKRTGVLGGGNNERGHEGTERCLLGDKVWLSRLDRT
jgi:hypothetical protein